MSYTSSNINTFIVNNNVCTFNNNNGLTDKQKALNELTFAYINAEKGGDNGQNLKLGKSGEVTDDALDEYISKSKDNSDTKYLAELWEDKDQRQNLEKELGMTDKKGDATGYFKQDALENLENSQYQNYSSYDSSIGKVYDLLDYTANNANNANTLTNYLGLNDSNGNGSARIESTNASTAATSTTSTASTIPTFSTTSSSNTNSDAPIWRNWANQVLAGQI